MAHCVLVYSKIIFHLNHIWSTNCHPMPTGLSDDGGVPLPDCTTDPTIFESVYCVITFQLAILLPKRMLNTGRDIGHCSVPEL